MPDESLLAALGLVGQARRAQASVAASGPDGHIDCPTLDIPPRCLELCTWVVIRAAGPGRPMESRLKHRNALCGATHGKTDQ